jgi:HEAT repeat protein
MVGQELQVTRAAKRALWRIVRDAGRPESGAVQKAVVAELIPLCKGDRPVSVRREVLWMLSELGGDESVDAVAALLSHEELREDARMALQRIPGRRSLDALKAGLAAAPDDFKLAIAQSLRKRGVEVPGLPCRKLVPTKQTRVQAVRS